MPKQPIRDRAEPVTGSRTGKKSKLTPKGERSRGRLIDAARQVFGRDGFQAARITDIADTAGSAHGTFYTYFDSKEAIFMALLEELEGGLIGPLRGGESEPPTAERPASRRASWSHYADIHQRNLDYLTYYKQNKDVLIVWEQVATFNEEVAALHRDATARIVARVQRSIDRMQAEGIVDPRINSAYAAPALTGMVSRFAYAWMLDDSDFDIDEAATQLSLIWALGLGIPVPQD